MRDRAAIAVGVYRRELDGLRVPAQRLKASARDLRLRLRPLWRVDLCEAEDRLNVAVLNGERVAVQDTDNDERKRNESLNHQTVAFVYTRHVSAIDHHNRRFNHAMNA